MTKGTWGSLVWERKSEMKYIPLYFEVYLEEGVMLCGPPEACDTISRVIQVVLLQKRFFLRAALKSQWL